MARLLLFIMSFLIVSPVFAEKDIDCGLLRIQIANATSQLCTLANSKVIHGNLVSAPPATLPPGYALNFDIVQSYYGPKIELEYKCSQYRVKFTSQQNYCFWKSGEITGKVLSHYGINATYTDIRGSFYWARPGLISWTIS